MIFPLWHHKHWSWRWAMRCKFFVTLPNVCRDGDDGDVVVVSLEYAIHSFNRYIFLLVDFFPFLLPFSFLFFFWGEVATTTTTTPYQWINYRKKERKTSDYITFFRILDYIILFRCLCVYISVYTSRHDVYPCIPKCYTVYYIHTINDIISSKSISFTYVIPL